MKIAVTGGLSCGKSSVCKIFRELGAYVVSADEIVHQLLSPDTTIGQEVIKLIGTEIVVDSKIDRSEIAKKVFNQPHLLHSLEKILHPEVEKEIEKYYQSVSQSKKFPLFIAEVPLLFEAGMEKNYDIVITVIASPEICEKRFLSVKGKNEKDFETRASFQLPSEEKARRADFVIFNNGSKEELEQSVKELSTKLRSLV